MYFVVIPRTLWIDKPEFGVWDAVKDEAGDLKTFDTIDNAREYGESVGREYYVFDLVG